MPRVQLGGSLAGNESSSVTSIIRSFGDLCFGTEISVLAVAALSENRLAADTGKSRVAMLETGSSSAMILGS